MGPDPCSGYPLNLCARGHLYASLQGMPELDQGWRSLRRRVCSCGIARAQNQCLFPRHRLSSRRSVNVADAGLMLKATESPSQNPFPARFQADAASLLSTVGIEISS